MPGRNWVAGIDTVQNLLIRWRLMSAEGGASLKFRRHIGLNGYFTLSCTGNENLPRRDLIEDRQNAGQV